MKFIIRSRTLFANLNGDKDRTYFEQSLDDLLRSFKLLVASPNSLLKSQGAILKNLHFVAVDLLDVYDSAKLWWAVLEFTFKSPFVTVQPHNRFSVYILEIIRNVPLGRLTQSKMACIKDLVDSKLFRMPQCREILLPEFCREIKEKLESKEEVRAGFHAMFLPLRVAYGCGFVYCYLLTTNCLACVFVAQNNL